MPARVARTALLVLAVLALAAHGAETVKLVHPGAAPVSKAQADDLEKLATKLLESSNFTHAGRPECVFVLC